MAVKAVANGNQLLAEKYVTVFINDGTLKPPVAPTLLPENAWLKPGATQKFQLRLPEPPPAEKMRWHLEPSGIGTLSESGLLTVSSSIRETTRGKVTLIVDYDRERSPSDREIPANLLALSVDFYVDPKAGEPGATLFYTQVSPEMLTALPREQVQFSARMIVPKGQAIPPHIFRWSLDNAALGTIDPGRGIFRSSQTEGAGGRVVAQAISEGTGLGQGFAPVQTIETEPWPEPEPLPQDPN
ncbi:MAG: hypothetical protein KY468_20870 [Armatimonadetes bacterium]|nr:hypothetical protein [Armatimonadota bacterium]